jgi:hypothetical protein
MSFGGVEDVTYAGGTVGSDVNGCNFGAFEAGGLKSSAREFLFVAAGLFAVFTVSETRVSTSLVDAWVTEGGFVSGLPSWAVSTAA